jgi:hypothetical protein
MERSFFLGDISRSSLELMVGIVGEVLFSEHSGARARVILFLLLYLKNTVAGLTVF